MENTNTPNEQNINQQFSQQFGQGGGSQPLPPATGALVLGIISTVFGLFWCYWIGSLIGVVCGIIALNMSKSGKRMVEANPSLYTPSSINNNNAGRILGIIGLCLGCLSFLILIFVLVFYAAFLSSMF